MLPKLERIPQMRRRLELTQTQLAKLAGVSQSLITKIERKNVEPSYSIARRIFQVLDEQLAKTQKELTAKKICTNEIIFINSKDSIQKAIKVMNKYAISQIPVVKEKNLIGSISEESLIKKYDKIKNKKINVEQIMDEPFPTISENTHITLIRDILKIYPAVILLKKGKPTGIISKVDLLMSI